MDKSIIKGAKTAHLFCRMQMRKPLDLPIRSSEMGVLIYVHESTTPPTPLDISEYFKMRKASVSGMVKTLLGKGYLMKKPSARDGRSYTLNCTEKGNGLVDHAIDDYHRAFVHLKDGMGEERYKQFIALMREANAILGKDAV